MPSDNQKLRLFIPLGLLLACTSSRNDHKVWRRQWDGNSTEGLLDPEGESTGCWDRNMGDPVRSSQQEWMMFQRLQSFLDRCQSRGLHRPAVTMQRECDDDQLAVHREEKLLPQTMVILATLTSPSIYSNQVLKGNGIDRKSTWLSLHLLNKNKVILP